MGASIHGYIERRRRASSRWFGWCAPVIGKDYLLFAFLANVRNWPFWEMEWPDGAESLVCLLPVSESKGLPDDLSSLVLTEHDGNTDYHSPTWLTIAEMEEVQRRYTSVPMRDLIVDHYTSREEAEQRRDALVAQGYEIQEWIGDVVKEGVYAAAPDKYVVYLEKLLPTRPRHAELDRVITAMRESATDGDESLVRYVCWWDN